MTASRDPDQLIHAYFEEGPDELPDPVYDAVRDRIEQTRQRADFGLWRTALMTKIVQYGLVATAAAVVVIIGFNLLGSGSPPPGGEVSPSVAPSVAPSEAAPSGDAFLPEGPFQWPDGADRQHPLDGPLITVTIPASGWRYGGWDSLMKGDLVGNLPESTLTWTSTTAGILVYKDACHWEYNVPYPPATTADEIAAALAAQPSRDASDPVDVTVGGYPGKVVTLHVPDDAVFADCFRGLYASWTREGEDGVGGEPWRFHQGPGQIDTFWIVDVDGAIVIIDAMYRADTPADRLQEMRAIVESATFEAP